MAFGTWPQKLSHCELGPTHRKIKQSIQEHARAAEFVKGHQSPKLYPARPAPRQLGSTFILKFVGWTHVGSILPTSSLNGGERAISDEWSIYCELALNSVYKNVKG